MSLRVVVVGGGASGLLVTSELLKSLSGGEIVVIDQTGKFGKGPAYGADCEHYLLNVRAQMMSAVHDEPSHLVTWLKEAALYCPSPTKGERGAGGEGESLGLQFIPRNLYARYLEFTYNQALSKASATVKMVKDEVIEVSAVGQNLAVRLASGVEIEADAVVVATGNPAPAVPKGLDAVASSMNYIGYPWAKDALEAVEENDEVLILGTALTMVDSAVYLMKNEHKGKIHARSMRGALPQAHAITTPVQIDWQGGDRLVHDVIAECRKAGDNWRAVIDSLRPRSNELWNSMGPRKQEQFARLMIWAWFIVRHRMPNPMTDDIEKMCKSGQLDIASGRVQCAILVDGRVHVTLRSKAGQIEELVVDKIINCTGSEPRIANTESKILRNVIAQGLAKINHLGLGLEADDDCRLNPSGRLWGMGNVLRGSRIETTAIPELRVQAAKIAKCLASGEFRAKKAGGES